MHPTANMLSIDETGPYNNEPMKGESDRIQQQLHSTEQLSMLPKTMLLLKWEKSKQELQHGAGLLSTLLPSYLQTPSDSLQVQFNLPDSTKKHPEEEGQQLQGRKMGTLLSKCASGNPHVSQNPERREVKCLQQRIATGVQSPRTHIIKPDAVVWILDPYDKKTAWKLTSQLAQCHRVALEKTLPAWSQVEWEEVTPENHPLTSIQAPWHGMAWHECHIHTHSDTHTHTGQNILTTFLKC